jgi:hypothetical protein
MRKRNGLPMVAPASDRVGEAIEGAKGHQQGESLEGDAWST